MFTKAHQLFPTAPSGEQGKARKSPQDHGAKGKKAILTFNNLYKLPGWISGLDKVRKTNAKNSHPSNTRSRAYQFWYQILYNTI